MELLLASNLMWKWFLFFSYDFLYAFLYNSKFLLSTLCVFLYALKFLLSAFIGDLKQPLS